MDSSTDAAASLCVSPPAALPFAPRPWGGFSTLAFLGDLGLVKIIRVSPNSRLSLQRHEKRAEHWVVLDGEGLAQVDHARRPLRRGDYVLVPRGAWHRLSNTSPEHEMIVAEVQVGAYVDEGEADADIERVADDYGRAAEGADGEPRGVR